ncbi:hypothetical protein [Pseudomonas sp. TAE6080]|uniref:hypothetical protein n=1 Tax=Pseudomonas sp. TAE6080 TaxID=2840374 RepID=UPI001C0072DE|nr:MULTISPECIES: hypothetical protein [Pseudomonas]MBT9304820.1 hypothetical protein [Pseudomonas sp. TAE6080]USW97409.1 hypothetical protein NHF39_13510 [Pseudomonas proteolytica]USW98368.1 hypothetical protein NHF41_17865 [Pseudomonas proteolytica]
MKVILYLWMCTNTFVPGQTDSTGCMTPMIDQKVYDSVESCTFEAIQRQTVAGFTTMKQPPTPQGKMLNAMDYRCVEWDGESAKIHPENTFQSDWAKSGLRLIRQ